MLCQYNSDYGKQLRQYACAYQSREDKCCETLLPVCGAKQSGYPAHLEDRSVATIAGVPSKTSVSVKG